MSERPSRKKSGKKSSRHGETDTSGIRTPKSRKSSKSASPKATDPATPTSIPPSPSTCLIHGKELTLFCESREEPVCEDCLLSPPYLGVSNKVIPLEEAYRYRLAAVYNTLNSHLYIKKEQIIAQMHRVEFRLEEIKRVKLMIERDMKNEFSAMQERLNSACGSKVAILTHDINELNNDLDRINFVITSVENSSQDMIGFLERSRELRESLEIAISKPFRTDIEVFPDDLPRELSTIRDMVAKFPALQALVTFKDEMIWKLMHERAGTGPLDETSERELAEWAKLTDKFATELGKYQLVCEYCGQPLDEDSVNSVCPKNSGYSIDTRRYSSHQGNERHFFVRPRPEKGGERVERESMRSSFIPDRDVDGLMRHIVNVSRERGISLERVFKEFDTLNTGIIEPTDLYYVLTNEFGLVGAQVTEMMNRYDIEKTGRIEYGLFLKDLSSRIGEGLEKLKEKSGNLLEFCRKMDVHTEGTVTQEMYKEGLRSLGLTEEEIFEVIQAVDLNSQGQVQYLTFHNKIKY